MRTAWALAFILAGAPCVAAQDDSTKVAVAAKTIEEFEEMKMKLFKKFDTDGDDVISLEEIQESLRATGADRGVGKAKGQMPVDGKAILKQMDRNRNGEVDMDEGLQFFENMVPAEPEIHAELKKRRSDAKLSRKARAMFPL